MTNRISLRRLLIISFTWQRKPLKKFVNHLPPARGIQPFLVFSIKIVKVDTIFCMHLGRRSWIKKGVLLCAQNQWLYILSNFSTSSFPGRNHLKLWYYYCVMPGYVKDYKTMIPKENKPVLVIRWQYSTQGPLDL